MTKEKQSTEHHGAHSQVRKGSSDYGDGGNTDYQLGNDDYIKNEKDYDRNFLEDAFSSGTGIPEEDIGKIAHGNKVDEEDDEEEDLVDEALRETFPASDPPGYISKSKIDKEQHP